MQYMKLPVKKKMNTMTCYNFCCVSLVALVKPKDNTFGHVRVIHNSPVFDMPKHHPPPPPPYYLLCSTTASICVYILHKFITPMRVLHF